MKCAKTVILFSLFAGALMPANILAAGKGKARPLPNPTGQANTQKQASAPKAVRPSSIARFRKNVSQKVKNAKATLRDALNKESEASSSDAPQRQSLLKRSYNKVKNVVKQKKATATTGAVAAGMIWSSTFRNYVMKKAKNNPTTALGTALLGTGLVTSEHLDTAKDVINYAMEKAEENPLAASAVGLVTLGGLFKAGKSILRTPQYQATMDVVAPAMRQNVSTASSWYNSVPGFAKEIARFLAVQKGIQIIGPMVGLGEQQDEEAQFIWFTNTIREIGQLRVPANGQLFERLELMAADYDEQMEQNVHVLRIQYTIFKVFTEHPDRIPDTQENRQRFQELPEQIEQLSNMIVARSYEIFYGQEMEPQELDDVDDVQPVAPIVRALENPALRNAVANRQAQNRQPQNGQASNNNNDVVTLDDEMPIVRALNRLQNNGENEGINPSLASILADSNLGPELEALLMDDPEFQAYMQEVTGGNQPTNAQATPATRSTQRNATAQNNRSAQRRAARPAKKVRAVKRSTPYMYVHGKREGFKRKYASPEKRRATKARLLKAVGRRHL